MRVRSFYAAADVKRGTPKGNLKSRRLCYLFFFPATVRLSFYVLDLSECQLMQIPDAVYHLMRHTELKRCDLSGNVITKIPPKFAVKFSLITGE